MQTEPEPSMAEFIPRSALVTGGAGFIGSHVVDALVAAGARVTVFDNFTTGRRRNLEQHAGSPLVRVIEADVLDRPAVESAVCGCDAVFHFQANADVRGGPDRTRVDLEQNTIATWNVLEASRLAGVRDFVFASSATVYGEPPIFPTPETCASPQTSLYGASKLACEGMIQAFSEYFGFRSLSFRFVSWVGERYSHGVVVDFVKKLRANPHALEILGDGTQRKSYLHVRDGLTGVFTALGRSTARTAVFNLGHEEFIPVTDVAAIVAEEMGLRDVEWRFTGGARGWPGDSPLVHLDTTAIRGLGWQPQISIEEGIRRTVRHLLADPHGLPS